MFPDRAAVADEGDEGGEELQHLQSPPQREDREETSATASEVTGNAAIIKKDIKEYTKCNYKI